MPGGRPTDDPKATLVAVRFSDRQRVILDRRVRREGISLSEAIRRCVDEWAAAGPRPRPPTPAEQRMFDQVFEAFGAKRRRRRRT